MRDAHYNFYARIQQYLLRIVILRRDSTVHYSELQPVRKKMNVFTTNRILMQGFHSALFGAAAFMQEYEYKSARTSTVH